MKKKIAFMILSSLMIAGASYFSSNNQILLLDEVDAEAETITYHDHQYLTRPTSGDKDEHEGYVVTPKSFDTSFRIVEGPKFDFYHGTTQEATIRIYVTTWHISCCMTGEGSCDFGNDFADCAKKISGYVHPSHENN